MREADKEKDLKLLLKEIADLHDFLSLFQGQLKPALSYQYCSRNNEFSLGTTYEIGYWCKIGAACEVYLNFKNKYYKKPVKVKV